MVEENGVLVHVKQMAPGKEIKKGWQFPLSEERRILMLHTGD